jgi:bacterioferritin-associated ferredoxin
MYICICNAVTDHEIHACVRDGARTLREISDQLGVATCCGRCAHSASQVIRHACAEQTETVEMAVAGPA